MSKSKKPVKRFLKQQSTIVTFPKKRIQFPSITRIIPELPSWSILRAVDRWVVAGFLSGALLLMVIVAAVQTYQNTMTLERVRQERVQYAKEIAFWKDVVGKYTGYRDAYFKLALLSYQTGKKDEAKTYLQKALELDPNFAEGLAFAELL